MSTATIFPDPQLERNAFGGQYTSSDIRDLVFHPGIIPPLSSSSISKKHLHAERKLGETEVSYFLPSRENGVNDMWVSALFGGVQPLKSARYLHLGCRAPPCLVERQRVASVWAVMRIRHPLLGAKVRMNAYDDISFRRVIASLSFSYRSYIAYAGTTPQFRHMKHCSQPSETWNIVNRRKTVSA